MKDIFDCFKNTKDYWWWEKLEGIVGESPDLTMDELHSKIANLILEVQKRGNKKYFTGIKDCLGSDGDKICEGDILTNINGGPQNYYKVKYSDEECRFRFVKLDAKNKETYVTYPLSRDLVIKMELKVCHHPIF